MPRLCNLQSHAASHLHSTYSSLPRRSTTPATPTSPAIVAYCRHGPTSTHNRKAYHLPITTAKLNNRPHPQQMAIGRLYCYTLSILAVAFCCISHYHMWPEKGYNPHSNVGNKFRKDPKVQKKERKKQREPDERRRKGGRDDDEPEWIADFNSKRRAAAEHAERIFLPTPKPTAGRPRRVSFEDEHPPDLRSKRSGTTVDGDYFTDYAYGRGSVKAGGAANVGSPPSGSARRTKTGSVKSPDSGSYFISPTNGSGRSRHSSSKSHSKTHISYPVQDGLVSPGSRAFSHDAT